MNIHGADVSMEEFSENEFDRLSQLHPDFDPERLENALKRMVENEEYRRNDIPRTVLSNLR